MLEPLFVEVSLLAVAGFANDLGVTVGRLIRAERPRPESLVVFHRGLVRV